MTEAPCDCVYCLWSRAIGKTLMEKMDREMMEGAMTKRIRLTVEWDGACSEQVYGDVLKEEIEDGDVSGMTRVTEIDCLTDKGMTFEESFFPSRRKRLRRWVPYWMRGSA